MHVVLSLDSAYKKHKNLITAIYILFPNFFLGGGGIFYVKIIIYDDNFLDGWLVTENYEKWLIKHCELTE